MSQTEISEAARPLIVQSGDGETIEAFGGAIQFKLGGPETGGSLVVGLASTVPGGGPPLHVHQNEDELFMVLEGRFSVLTNGEWVEIGPGGVAYTPRGNVHTFRNVGDTVGRFWLVATPSGFDTFYRRCSKVFAAGGPPDMTRIMEICREHGIEILGPPPGAAPEGA